eukprot:65825_1
MADEKSEGGLESAVNKVIRYLSYISVSSSISSINDNVKNAGTAIYNLRDRSFLSADYKKLAPLLDSKLSEILPIVSDCIRKENVKELYGCFFGLCWIVSKFIVYMDEWPWILSGLIRSLMIKLQDESAWSYNKQIMVLLMNNMCKKAELKQAFKKSNVSKAVMTCLKNDIDGNQLTVLFRVLLIVSNTVNSDILWIVSNTNILERLLYEFDCALNNKLVTKYTNASFWADVWDRVLYIC